MSAYLPGIAGSGSARARCHHPYSFAPSITCAPPGATFFSTSA